MQFFKMEGMLVNAVTEAGDSSRTQRAWARKIGMKGDAFCRKQGRGSYCFVSYCSDSLLTLGLITDCAENARSLMDGFLKHIDCHLQDVTFTETTISGLEQLLRTAQQWGYIECSTDVLEKYGIDKLTKYTGRYLAFGENLIESSTRADIYRTAERYLLDETLLPELDRIYACTPTAKVQGHPVHYMLQTDNEGTRREAGRLLLQALYANGRLRSQRYCFLDFRPGQDFPLMTYDQLYRICDGGAVLVRYLANDDAEDGNVANAERTTIEQLCEVARRYCNQVLTIFCLPRECRHAKSIFYEYLGNLTLVEIREDFSDHPHACAYLKMLAKDRHVRTDKALFAMLDPQKGYLATELHSIFDEWYNRKLKTTIYPQYQHLTTARPEAIKAAPKGSAYEELQEMIGLNQAKAVIQKALNYYKLQRLYADKGLQPDNPAMHMVFTGNPGTAKTTAARLFARIMKDNGLLSKGQLVEVGRGDLVGKYVGWTAQTVQKKFKAAMGGVLFIDEAYALVDDANGSFGDEAINTIVQEMENHREDVVVIFAGYPREMERFLQKNPGLRSRIAFHVPFADYSAQELCSIAQLMGKSKGIHFEADALTKMEAVFEQARQQSDFGNGRYVRNLLEQARMNQASRLLEYDFDAITAEAVKTIQAVDIVMPENKAEVRRTIGFAS